MYIFFIHVYKDINTVQILIHLHIGKNVNKIERTRTFYKTYLNSNVKYWRFAKRHREESEDRWITKF